MQSSACTCVHSSISLAWHLHLSTSQTANSCNNYLVIKQTDFYQRRSEFSPLETTFKNQSREDRRERKGEGGVRPDRCLTLALPWVFYLPRETTNLSESGLPPILLPRTNGEERGSHSRGAFPRSCHTSHQRISQGRGSKHRSTVPFPQLHPFTPSEPKLLGHKVEFSKSWRAEIRPQRNSATTAISFFLSVYLGLFSVKAGLGML